MMTVWDPQLVRFSYESRPSSATMRKIDRIQIYSHLLRQDKEKVKTEGTPQ